MEQIPEKNPKKKDVFEAAPAPEKSQKTEKEAKPPKEKVAREPEEEKETRKPEEILANNLDEIMRSENPDETLFKKVLGGEVPLDLVKPIQLAAKRLDGVFDIKERGQAIQKMLESGETSPELKPALVIYLLKEEQDSLEKLTSFARRELAALAKEEKFGEKNKEIGIKINELREKVFRGFVKEADRLFKQYGEEIPEEELNKIRGRLMSLDKRTREYVRSRVGAQILKQAERRPGEETAGQTAQKELLNFYQILFGKEQTELMQNFWEIYRAAFRDAGKSGKDEGLVKRSRAAAEGERGDPLPNTENMHRVAKYIRGWIRQKPEIDPEKLKELRQNLEAVENFVLKAGKDDEAKKEIQNARFREEEEKMFVKKAKDVRTITRELEDYFTPERIKSGLREHRQEIGERLRKELEKLLGAPVLEAKNTLRATLFLNSFGSELKRETAELSAEGAAPEKPRPGIGEELKYTPAGMRRLFEDKLLGAVEKREQELRSKITAARKAGDKTLLKKTEDALKAVSETKNEKNYMKQLFILALHNLISPEEYKIAADLLEARAAADDLSAKESEAAAAELRELDLSKFTPTDRGKIVQSIKENSENAEDLRALAEETRKGNIL